MAEFLLELFAEEIPARMQGKAATDLGDLIGKALDEAELTFKGLRTFVTPRRLVLVIDDLAAMQPDVEIERKGPRVGAPEKAMQGFLKSLGTDDYRLEEREEKKGKVLFAHFRRIGRPAIEVLPALIEGVLVRFPWPKSMRWGDHEIRWVRPLQRILCLLDGKVVPVAFGPIRAGNVTEGHRFMAGEPFEVTSFSDYEAKLARAFVVLDTKERRARIKGQAELIVRNEGLRLRNDEALLDELAGLVEWPVALAGSIDETFMELPKEVLITSMRSHQKYLALETEAGELAPRFIAVANRETKDGGAAIVAGNERVLRARLWDAKFFWDQDLKTPLEARLPALDQVVFHAKLGSIGDKARRLEQLAGWLATKVSGAGTYEAARAAKLAKADLVTGMVGEFPELQGVMGRYYAEHQGEAADVVGAIGEHYAPQGPNDVCPSKPVSVTVALADKLDSLTGFFAADEKPTGSKDPFALRRAALGVIRLILENRLRLPLREAFAQARYVYAGLLEQDDSDAPGSDQLIDITNDLQAFFTDRLKVHLREQGVRHDLIAAVFARSGGDTKDDFDLISLIQRAEALDALLATNDGANLLAAHRRASNIVRIEEKKEGKRFEGPPNPAKLHEPAEIDLLQKLDEVETRIEAAMENELFEKAMTDLATLRRPIDQFFDSVMVNVDDPSLRGNRLKLLKKIGVALDTIADFSKIEDVTSNPPQNRQVA